VKIKDGRFGDYLLNVQWAYGDHGESHPIAVVVSRSRPGVPEVILSMEAYQAIDLAAVVYDEVELD